MIKSLGISNYKLHKDSHLELGGLTILSGMNGMGKSSVFQALLLLRQSFMLNDLKTGLNLKGDLCDVGVSGELACQASESSKLELEIDFTSQTLLKYGFVYPNNTYDTLMLGDESNPKEQDFLNEYPLFNNRFQYISAFRFGPQRSYERDTSLVVAKRQISKVMGKCEYVVHFLEHYKNEEIPIKALSLCGEGESEDYRLSEQVERWMRRVAPNIKMNIEKQNEDFRLKYRYDRNDNTITDEISAMNTGFGISYMLPILVAILSAREDSLILVENPEAHIHPSGQAVLMELVCLAANNGIQIIIETHSDHIVNGALVGIHKGLIPSDNISVYFFDRDEHEHVCNPQKLNVTPEGTIVRTPKGFFDQMDMDLRIIAGF